MQLTEQDNAKILLVDDHPVNLGVLFQLLNDKGFTVLVAQDGERVLQQVKQIQPDLILLDVMMPGIDGFEVCRRLKQDEETQDIPVIFLTGLSDTIDKVRGFEVGGVDFITKPIRQEEVYARLKTHLAFRKLQQQLEEQNAVLTQGSVEVTKINTQLQQEIVKRTQTEQALRESERRFGKVIKHAVDAILVIDQDNIVRFVNPAAEALFDYREESLVGKQFVLPVRLGESTEFEIPQRDGSVSIVEIRAVEIEWENQPAYLESLRDITRHKQLEEALRISQSQLEASFQLEQQRRQLSDTLREVAAIVSSTLNQQEVLQLILEQLENVVMYHRATVSLLEQDLLTVVAGKDKMGGNVVRGTYPAREYPLNAQVLANKQPVLLPDVTKDSRWQPTDTMQKIRSFILAPLLVQEERIGILSIGRLDEIPYDADDAQTVFAFASQVAISVRNAQLHAGVQERNRRLALLHEISLAVNSSLDLHTLLTAACRTLVEKFHVDHSGVVLFDGSYTYGEVLAEYPGWNAQGIRIPLTGYTSTQRMIKTSQPEVIVNAQHDPAMEKVWEIMRSLGIQSILIVPLILKEQVIGSFSLDMTTITRHFSSSEITLSQTIASQLAIAIDNARLLEKERALIEQELETARQIQVSLLPASAPKMHSLDIAGVSEPARVVGGDFYNFFVFDQERLGIAVGDVSGKGMQAALMMALSFGLLTTEVRRDVNPADLLAVMGRELYPHTQRNWMNTALSYITITPSEPAESRVWNLRVANAGLIAPLLRRQDRTVEWLYVRGLPLGVMPETSYEELQWTLQPGDLLLLSSDGVIEAMNREQEMYEFERFAAAVAAAPDQSAQAVLDWVLQDVQAFTEGAEAHDDITLVVVMMKGKHG